MTSVGTLINTIVGYVFVFLARKDSRSAQEIITLGISLLQGIKKETDAPDFLDRTYAELYILLSHVQLETGKIEEANTSIANAARQAARFDAAPDYGVTSFRYGTLPESVSLFDCLGVTAAGGVENMIRLLGDPELLSRWKEVTENGR